MDAPKEEPKRRRSKREQAEDLLREARQDELWDSIRNAAKGMTLAAREKNAADACGHADAALQALEELDRLSKGEAQGG